MVKYFCDVCGVETPRREYVGTRYCPKFGKVKCEIMVSVNNVWNKGVICLKCLKEVLRKGKEGK